MVVLGLLGSAALSSPAVAAVPLERVSVSSAEGQARAPSYAPAMSGDGRFVAFTSEADFQVRGAFAGPDVFLRDRRTGTTVLVSATSRPGNGASSEPSISTDGRYVAFLSRASNLVPGDTNGAADAFMKDMRTGVVTRIGLQGWSQITQGVTAPQLTGDGRSVLFSTPATLVPADTTPGDDLYLRSLATGRVELVSHGFGRLYGGEVEGAHGRVAQASADGRYVAYRSASDGPGYPYTVWLRDTVLDTSRDLYVRAGFTVADDYVDAVAVSANGRWVAFVTDAVGRPDDPTEDDDAWFYDTRTGAFSRSAPTWAVPVTAEASSLALSGNGRVLVYAGGAERGTGIWAHDRRTGLTVRLARTPTYGSFSHYDPDVAAVSATGRVFAFSASDTLTSSDTNAVSDVYLRSMPDCTIVGTSGDDVLSGTAGDDVICGMAGDDVIKGQGGDDTLSGGAGVDKVDYADASRGVTVDLRSGRATGQGTDMLLGVERVDGSPYADHLVGDEEDNALAGRAGDDYLRGQAGDDQVWGGPGFDTVGGGEGHDQLAGGPGTDTVTFHDATQVSVDLNQGRATDASWRGFTWVDTLKDIENVSGSHGDDYLRGNGVANTLWGHGGNDTILGQAANDALFGGSGDDALTGGTGKDRCVGGDGTDSAATCETTSSVP